MDTINRYENELIDIKYARNNITRNQLKFYYQLLLTGKDNRGQGLSWIIKVIWHLKGDIKPENFPKCLDNESIIYLIKISRLNLEKEKLVEELNSIRSKNSNSDKDSEDSDKDDDIKVYQLCQYR